MTAFALQNDYNHNQDEGEVSTLESMEVTVYLDMFFLVNFLVDLILLDLMRHFMRLRGNYRRLICGAAAGAAGACLILVSKLWLFVWFAGSKESPRGLLSAAEAAAMLGLGAGMLMAAFGKAEKKEFAGRLAMFWCLGICMGGFLSLAERPEMADWRLSEMPVIRQWRTAPLFFRAAGGWLGMRALQICLAGRRKRQALFYKVMLHYHGRSQMVTALWDTGNHLYEPYGHQPVHVITEDALRRLCETVNRIVFIPFRAVGTGYGLLPGIRIDSMDVLRQGEVVRHYERPWLAVSRGALSAKGQYEMLLHGEEREK